MDSQSPSNFVIHREKSPLPSPSSTIELFGNEIELSQGNHKRRWYLIAKDVKERGGAEIYFPLLGLYVNVDNKKGEEKKKVRAIVLGAMKDRYEKFRLRVAFESDELAENDAPHFVHASATTVKRSTTNVKIVERDILWDDVDSIDPVRDRDLRKYAKNVLEFWIKSKTSELIDFSSNDTAKEIDQAKKKQGLAKRRRSKRETKPVVPYSASSTVDTTTTSPAIEKKSMRNAAAAANAKLSKPTKDSKSSKNDKTSDSAQRAKTQGGKKNLKTEKRKEEMNTTPGLQSRTTQESDEDETSALKTPALKGDASMETATLSPRSLATIIATSVVQGMLAKQSNDDRSKIEDRSSSDDSSGSCSSSESDDRGRLSSKKNATRTKEKKKKSKKKMKKRIEKERRKKEKEKEAKAAKVKRKLQMLSKSKRSDSSCDESSDSTSDDENSASEDDVPSYSSSSMSKEQKLHYENGLLKGRLQQMQMEAELKLLRKKFKTQWKGGEEG